MGAVLAFLKSVYEQKEKIILGILILAFVGMAFVQFRAKKNSGSNNETNGDPEQQILGSWKPAPPRKPKFYKIPTIANPYPLDRYFELLGKRNIFAKLQEEKGAGQTKEKAEWAEIRIKSVFDPTQSGTYIAIIEVNKRSRIVKEGQVFEGYEVLRIDGVRRCLTIGRRDWKDEREFCEEE